MVRKLVRHGHRWAENRTVGQGGEKVSHREEVGGWQGSSERCDQRGEVSKQGSWSETVHLGLDEDRQDGFDPVKSQ